MGPAPAADIERLDEFIKEFEPEGISFEVSNQNEILKNDEILHSVFDLAESGYGERPQSIETAGQRRIDPWGYVQVVGFSFVTASYLLYDYLERNNIDTAVSEAKRRSWILLLALALISHLL